MSPSVIASWVHGVGVAVGAAVGVAVGSAVGVGVAVGGALGVGVTVGSAVGVAVGVAVGSGVGVVEGVGVADGTAVSFAAYPFLAEHYQLFACGASVGDGYGPLLVGRSPDRSPQPTHQGSRTTADAVARTGSLGHLDALPGSSGQVL